MSHDRSRLEWSTLLICLLVLGAYITWSLTDHYRTIQSQEYQRLTAQTKIVDHYLSDQVAAIRRVLELMRKQVPSWQSRSEGLSDASRELQGFLEALIDVRSLAVLDEHGNVIASSRGLILNQNFSDREYFQTALNDPSSTTLHLSEPFTAVTNKWIMVLSLRVNDDEGNFKGVVVASIDPERFRLTLNSVNYEKDMWSALAHGDGTQLLMDPERSDQKGMNLAQPGSFFSRHVESGNQTSLLTGTVYATGESRVMALRSIQPEELHFDKPLILAVGRDLDQVYSDWREFSAFRISAFILFSAVAIFMMFRLQRALHEKAKNAATASLLIQEKNTELERLNETLKNLALIDSLTGIANRRSFDEMLQNEWRRCQRDAVPLSLMMIDIDYFKDFNDHYGHLKGDECITLIAKSINQSLLRSSDFVARFGGEEFVCLLPKTDLESAKKLAESLRQNIESLQIPHEYSSVAQGVTVSVGVASDIPNDASNAKALLAKADEYLYYAKAAGRNQIYSGHNLIGSCQKKAATH